MTDYRPITRLEDQIAWYDTKASLNQRWFKGLKAASLAMAGLVPLLAATPVPRAMLGLVGAAAAMLGGLQQLNQYNANWIAYRSTCEALKHEKFLYLARAAHFASAADRTHFWRSGSNPWSRRNTQSGLRRSNPEPSQPLEAARMRRPRESPPRARLA